MSNLSQLLPHVVSIRNLSLTNLMSPAKMPKNGKLLNKTDTIMSKVLICSIKNLSVHLQQK